MTRAPGDDGVLFATGTENSGLSLFVQDDRLVVDYNAFDDHTVVESDVEVPAGDSTLTLRLRRGEGRTGSAAIEIDGVEAGRADLSLFMRMMSSVGPSIASDHGSAVSPRYEAPFPFSGKLHEIVIQILSDRGVDAAVTEAAVGMSRQ